jgi:negative regulator of genetic competence, sporulation and motility
MYGFDKKRKKEEKKLEHKKNVKNVSMHQENNRKNKKKKTHQFWVFSTSFNTIFNVLNFLGVVFCRNPTLAKRGG